MKKLFLKLLLLSLPVTIPAMVVALFPLPSNSSVLAIIDKHRRLKQTESPRLVLAGGSNLAYGIDSGRIQDALNIPVINAGLNAGFGLGRILDDLVSRLNSGDILLIAPEYDHFSSSWNGTEIALWNGDGTAYNLIFDAHQYRLLVKPTVYGFPSGFLSYLQSRKKRVSDFKNNIFAKTPPIPNPLAQLRDGFNEYGDYVKHLTMENRELVSYEPIENIEARYLARFFRLVDTFSKRGVTVLISYPSYEEALFLASEPFIRELDAAFRDRGVTVISSPEDFAFPWDCFYDTVYHLNAKGRERRTSRLIRDLARYVP
ncbi:MAG: hypothetical protein LBT00_10655 [Spirochaetaceae bacterium]|jgi:hypothetical protein|nr:hypothetical protein [Spirochaetaceae bacterium]